MKNASQLGALFVAFFAMGVLIGAWWHKTTYEPPTPAPVATPSENLEGTNIIQATTRVLERITEETVRLTTLYCVLDERGREATYAHSVILKNLKAIAALEAQ